MSDLEKIRVGSFTDAVIFDLDGTILDSSEEVLLCLAEAFDQEGFVVDQTRFTPNVIGPPLDAIVKSILPTISDEDANKVVDSYNMVYDSEKYANSDLYADVYSLLIELKEANKKLFIATNKPNSSTLRLIKKFKLFMFDEIYVIDKYSERILSKTEMIQEIIEKYNLNKDKTIMIGDALSDITAAQDNGIKAIGVLWGYGDNKQPLIDTADAVVKKVADLTSFL